MQIGDLVWARWQDDCYGIVIGYTFDEINVEYLYRIKWWLTGYVNGHTKHKNTSRI